jgi:hypothetical protein
MLVWRHETDAGREPNLVGEEVTARDRYVWNLAKAFLHAAAMAELNWRRCS